MEITITLTAVEAAVLRAALADHADELRERWGVDGEEAFARLLLLHGMDEAAGLWGPDL